jgi:hypothetical protein
MFEAIQLRNRVRNLQRERDRALVEPSQKNTAAEAAKAEDERTQWMADYFMVKDEYEDQIDSLVTRYLTRQAELYMLPIPDYSDELLWRESKTSLSARYLTRVGKLQLQTVIREHERQERDRLGFWITSLVGVLGGIIGVIGVLIAYAALNQKP